MFDINLVNIPKGPGIYIMKDAIGKIIYVGKAKSLPDRVKSYFSHSADHTEKTNMLVSCIASIEFVRTDTEVEALVLESNMIKTHYPKFNIDLKDSHSYSYIKVTGEKYPRLLLSRRARSGKFSGPAGKVYGPYAQGSARILAVGALRKVFKVRTCRVLPKAACLQYYLGNCDAPCIGKISAESYLQNMAMLESTLASPKKAQAIAQEFEQKMRESAKRLEFESAKHYRDSARVLSSNFTEQKFELDLGYDEDYIAAFQSDGMAYVEMFNVVKGVVKDRKKYSFAMEDKASEPLEEFMLAYYSKNRPPNYIYANAQASASLQQWLGLLRGSNVELRVPKKGEKSRLLELLANNAMSDAAGNIDAGLVAIRVALGLSKPPVVIECFDISNLFGTNVVGSMSRFVNSAPDRQGYRRFKIRTVEGQDDFASIEEIVFRRYKRLQEEGAAFPDLVLIDGGPGQLSSAMLAMSKLGIDLPCVSIAKEFEEIYSPKFDKPLRLSRKDAGLKILQHARDEAHRFGIAYHRKLRGKKIFLEKG